MFAIKLIPSDGGILVNRRSKTHEWLSQVPERLGKYDYFWTRNELKEQLEYKLRSGFLSVGSRVYRLKKGEFICYTHGT